MSADVPSSRKIRVLIVDDSASVRATLSDIIAADPDLEVMATAADPYVAAERIRHEVPDVIFLDLEMPRMDGLTFLRKLMSQHPVPVVICSSLTESGSDLSMQSLEAGAVEIVTKPRVDTAQFLQESSMRICDAAKAAAHAKLRGVRKAAPQLRVEAKLNADVIIPPLSASRAAALRERLPLTEPVICIGASTGGTEALREVLQALPATAPGIVVVQHMPENFTNAFARRLDGLCAMAVKEAADGDEVTAGRVLIAPGNRHMLLHRTGTRYSVRIVDGPHVSRHRPAVDVLFRSAAQNAGHNGMGMLLTGMGDDGARGLLEMREAGAFTIAQDEDSSIVFGMPKEAIQRGAAMRVLPLDRMAAEIVTYAGAPRRDGVEGKRVIAARAPVRSVPAASGVAAIAADLGVARARLETIFVDVGDWLSQSATLLNRIATTFEALPQDLASPELTEATARLERVAARAHEISASFETEQSDLARLVAVVAAAEQPISDLRRTIKMMGIVAINARVVAASIGGKADDFDVFTTDIAQLLEGATATIQQFSGAYQRLTGEVNKAAGQRAQFEAAHNDTLSGLAARLETNLGDVIRRRAASAEGSAETGRVSRQITARIASAVMAMQVGDFTRQRLEHIEVALADLATLVAGQPARDVALDASEGHAATADLGHLLALQLASTAGTFDGEGAEAEQALRALATDAATIMARSQDIYGETGARGQSSLSLFSIEMRRAVAVLRSCEIERGKLERVATGVQATVRILLDHVEAVREIEANMRLVSLNAAVRCAQLGPRGRALNVIARQLRELTGDTVMAAEGAMQSLEEATALAQSFCAASGGEATGQIGWLEQEAVASLGLLETVDQRLNDALGLLNQDGPAAIRRVAEAAARLAGRADLSEVMADTHLRIVALRGNDPAPRSPSPGSGPLLAALRRTYTMEAERHLHDAFAGKPAMPTAGAAAASLDSVFL